MVFRPPPREMIELLRSILHKLDATETESGDLAYLTQAIQQRITELEAAQKIESSVAEIPSTHREAA